MPPRFEHSQVGRFYRPCWNAHERGPPVGQMRPVFGIIPLFFNLNYIGYLHYNRHFTQPSPPPLLSGADSIAAGPGYSFPSRLAFCAFFLIQNLTDFSDFILFFSLFIAKSPRFSQFLSFFWGVVLKILTFCFFWGNLPGQRY